MADALCGPSNALQNFKQHTQVDRSLQQDRLVGGPQGPLTQQGFRTQDPRAGSLDAEFHAFENASANPFLHQEPLMRHDFNVNSQPGLRQAVASPDWATDFQHLHISNQPVPVQQFHSVAPMRTSTSVWQTQFTRQQQQQQQKDLQSSVAQGKQAVYGQYTFPSHVPQAQSLMPSTMFRAEEPYPLQHDEQSEATDWSRAFEEAFQDVHQDIDQIHEVAMAQDVLTNLSEPVADDLVSSLNPTEQIRIGSDAIDYVEMKDRTVDQERQDANALARVAGELLHNVQHDNSEKFQNSQFLSLMRKIRDRQVEVRDNDFEETTAVIDPAKGLAESDLKRLSDPIQNQDTFSFPGMNAVYAPQQADFVDYSFDSDQYPAQPHIQSTDLHPGGKMYPEQSPMHMSGAVHAAYDSTSSGKKAGTNISLADFEVAYDENRELASRFQKLSA